MSVLDGPLGNTLTFVQMGARIHMGDRKPKHPDVGRVHPTITGYADYGTDCDYYPNRENLRRGTCTSY